MDSTQRDVIIQGLYAGVMAPDGWQHVLGQLCALTNSEQAAFLVWDKRRNQTVIAEVAKWDLDAIADYERHFAAIDPGRPAVECTRLGEWYIDARDLGLPALAKHDFFQVFMRRHGMGSGMCTPLLRNADVLAGLSFQTGLGRRHFDAADAARLDWVMPHLLQAAQLRWQYRELSSAACLGQRVIDHVCAPLLVMDPRANVLYANRAGQHWLGSQRSHFSAHTLNRQNPSSVQLLQLARRICGTCDAPARAAAIRLEPTAGEAPVYLVGLPLRESHPLWRRDAQPAGVVIVHDTGGQSAPWPELLRQLFGLTPAELRTLGALPRHDSLQDMADMMGLTRETTRSHLKSIFRKTGIHSQAGLLRLLARFAQFQ